ncbi:MAG: VWA domain-containing protein [Phycisphaerae bacterium]
MTIDFRCENCGKLLSVEGEAGGSVKCPHCGKKAAVPAGLAALPHPHVAPTASAPAGTVLPPAAVPMPAEQPQAESAAVIGVMALIMPWIISVFFHLGLALILAFATMFVQQGAAAPLDAEVIVPDAAWSDTPGGSIVEGKSDSASERISTVDRKEYTKREAVADTGLTARRAPISVAGVGGPGGSGGTGSGAGTGLGLKGGGPGGPRTGFFGRGGNAHHVVFVIDRSGSMLDTFDYVRKEMLNSIARLKEVQDFHVIFFAAGTPQENPPRQLVPASDDYKNAAAEFLQGIRPEGQTNPLPAIARAFEVLERADKRPGKLIYLLTDGVFPDNDAVLKLIAQLNAKKDVLICTFLYDDKSADAVKVLQKIAEDNRGHFKQVRSSE